MGRPVAEWLRPQPYNHIIPGSIRAGEICCLSLPAFPVCISTVYQIKAKCQIIIIKKFNSNLSSQKQGPRYSG